MTFVELTRRGQPPEVSIYVELGAIAAVEHVPHESANVHLRGGQSLAVKGTAAEVLAKIKEAERDAKSIP